MTENKVSEIREGEEIFLSYKDDNEQIVSGFFILISISETLLQVKSNQNVLVIPISRLIKIKQRFSK
jgi:histone acetyltransferase (RNA polymerase elongator complex component)